MAVPAKLAARPPQHADMRSVPKLGGKRERLEMVLLSDAGWSPPRIARHQRQPAVLERGVKAHV